MRIWSFIRYWTQSYVKEKSRRFARPGPMCGVSGRAGRLRALCGMLLTAHACCFLSACPCPSCPPTSALACQPSPLALGGSFACWIQTSACLCVIWVALENPGAGSHAVQCPAAGAGPAGERVADGGAAGGSARGGGEGAAADPEAEPRVWQPDPAWADGAAAAGPAGNPGSLCSPSVLVLALWLPLPVRQHRFTLTSWSCVQSGLCPAPVPGAAWCQDLVVLGMVHTQNKALSHHRCCCTTFSVWAATQSPKDSRGILLQVLLK